MDSETIVSDSITIVSEFETVIKKLLFQKFNPKGSFRNAKWSFRILNRPFRSSPNRPFLITKPATAMAAARQSSDQVFFTAGGGGAEPPGKVFLPNGYEMNGYERDSQRYAKVRHFMKHRKDGRRCDSDIVSICFATSDRGRRDDSIQCGVASSARNLTPFMKSLGTCLRTVGPSLADSML